MNITATKTSNHNGRTQVVAKGNGKQRTVSWDHSRSADWNYGNAAGTLALVLFQGETSRRIAAETAKVIKSEDGKRVFSIGV